MTRFSAALSLVVISITSSLMRYVRSMSPRSNRRADRSEMPDTFWVTTVVSRSSPASSNAFLSAMIGMSYLSLS